VEWIPARLAIVATALALLVVTATGAEAVAPSDKLPDLVSDPPAMVELDDYAYAGGPKELLLRFDGFVHNKGAGALEVRGARASDGEDMTPLQRVYRTDGTHHDDPMPGAELFYTNADGHNHFHVQRIARYSLWAGDKSAEVAPAMKVGFCLEDSTHVDAHGPQSEAYNGASWCEHNHPTVLSVVEGVSAGWRDRYPADLTFQWVVASDVQPGRYWLREDIDTEDLVQESDESNAPAWSASQVTIPGYVAGAVVAPATPYGLEQDVTLSSTAFGSPGARRFQVVEAPAHGTLDVAIGESFSGPKVTYTPAPGYSGPDSFVYEARDSTSPYPRHPSTATVALSVGPGPEPSVVIDSAPTAVQVGHGVQLHATVTNDVPAVTWSVNGVDGGGVAIGTISADGFYTAPASPPPGGHVTIAARSASGAYDAREVAITDPLPPPPSPGVADGRRTRGALLSGIGEAVTGRLLVATVTPARAGLVSINARADGRLIGTCRDRVPRNRRFTCRLNVAPGLDLARLKVVARLFQGGRVIARISQVGKPSR
jgi:Lysyl oxidase/Bacterial Ig domain